MLTRTNPKTGGAVDTAVEARSTPVEAPARRRRSVWLVAAIAVVVLGGSLAATAVLRSGGREDVEATPSTGPAVGSQEFLQRLADQGYIPKEAVDQRQLLVERLAAGGTIPAASARRQRDIPEHLRYTAYEEQLIKAVQGGFIPKETLDSDTLRLKRLVNEPRRDATR